MNGVRMMSWLSIFAVVGSLILDVALLRWFWVNREDLR